MTVIVVPRAPRPSLDAVRDGAAAFAEKARERARPNDPGSRDGRFIGRILPMIGGLYDSYFRCETELEEHVPSGPFIAVANHNGMTGIPDMFCHMVAFWRLYGPERRSHGLMHDVPFRLPLAGGWLNASGALSASHQNAEQALSLGAALLVFPGGDVDSCKPFRDRYVVDFGRRRGFLRAAIRAGVPIVPIVSVGAHHSLYIWSDGRRIAEALRLPSIARSNVAPLGFALPFGLIAGIAYPHLPPPVKIHTRILRRIDLGLPASAASDSDAVERAYERVVGAMRVAMDELRRAGRHGLFPRGAPVP